MTGRIATFLLALAVMAIGFVITQDPCNHSSAVACGTTGERRFDESAGWVGLALGVACLLLLWAARRRLAVLAVSLGGASCLAALAEGVRHWAS